jgi:poly(glycerol-phosphate) alpha-glucosyltransferase
MTPECNLPEGFAADAAVRLETSMEGIAPGLKTLQSTKADELAEMGSRGRMLVEQKFTWPTIAAQVKATYEWMLGGGTTPDWIFDETEVGR